MSPSLFILVKNELCSYPPKNGRCKMNITKIFFNPNTNECELFSYSGCGGNANNFMSMRECESKCKKRGSIPMTIAPVPIVAIDNIQNGVAKDVQNTPKPETVAVSVAPNKTDDVKKDDESDKRHFADENVKTVQFGVVGSFDDMLNKQAPKYVKMAGEIDKTVSRMFL